MQSLGRKKDRTHTRNSFSLAIEIPAVFSRADFLRFDGKRVGRRDYHSSHKLLELGNNTLKLLDNRGFGGYLLLHRWASARRSALKSVFGKAPWRAVCYCVSAKVVGREKVRSENATTVPAFYAGFTCCFQRMNTAGIRRRTKLAAGAFSGLLRRLGCFFPVVIPSRRFGGPRRSLSGRLVLY